MHLKLIFRYAIPVYQTLKRGSDSTDILIFWYFQLRPYYLSPLVFVLEYLNYNNLVFTKQDSFQKKKNCMMCIFSPSQLFTLIQAFCVDLTIKRRFSPLYSIINPIADLATCRILLNFVFCSWLLSWFFLSSFCISIYSRFKRFIHWFAAITWNQIMRHSGAW